MKRLYFLTLLLFLIFPLTGHALPASVKLDMLKTKLVEQLKADDYSAALQTMQELKASGIKLPASFEYFEGKALFESGHEERSFDKFSHYAETQGRSAKYYKESISYMVKVEEAVARKEQEKKEEVLRQERERERAVKSELESKKSSCRFYKRKYQKAVMMVETSASDRIDTKTKYGKIRDKYYDKWDDKNCEDLLGSSIDYGQKWSVFDY